VILFPQSIFILLVVGALVWTGLGALVLVSLLIKDIVKKQIW
jgi:hypothetical protein